MLFFILTNLFELFFDFFNLYHPVRSCLFISIILHSDSPSKAAAKVSVFFIPTKKSEFFLIVFSKAYCGSTFYSFFITGSPSKAVAKLRLFLLYTNFFITIFDANTELIHNRPYYQPIIHSSFFIFHGTKH